MQTGGALWFTDLTIADPYYALPVITGLTFLLTVELGAADGMQGQPPEQMAKMKNFMRIFAVALVPLSASLPQVSLGAIGLNVARGLSLGFLC